MKECTEESKKWEDCAKGLPCSDISTDNSFNGCLDRKSNRNKNCNFTLIYRPNPNTRGLF